VTGPAFSPNLKNDYYCFMAASLMMLRMPENKAAMQLHYAVMDE
jgi:hypothetical protein